MGSWLSDAWGSINWNPTYSPVYQAVAPVVDVVSTAVIGVPVASAVNLAAGALDPKKPAPAPVYGGAPAPAPIVSTQPAAAGTPATPAMDNTTKYLLWGLGGLALAGVGYAIYRSNKKG